MPRRLPGWVDASGMEALRGYRAWLADREGRLRSLAVESVWWRPGQVVAATCDRPVHLFDDLDLGPAPHAANHPCGWHAYHTLETLVEHLALDITEMEELTLVCGLVEGGGRTQEHAFGWRAQYALPVAIIRFVPEDPEQRSRVLLAQYLASERYRIPLIDRKDA